MAGLDTKLTLVLTRLLGLSVESERHLERLSPMILRPMNPLTSMKMPEMDLRTQIFVLSSSLSQVVMALRSLGRDVTENWPEISYTPITPSAATTSGSSTTKSSAPPANAKD